MSSAGSELAAPAETFNKDAALASLEEVELGRLAPYDQRCRASGARRAGACGKALLTARRHVPVPSMTE
jgi:hypothetical protein